MVPWLHQRAYPADDELKGVDFVTLSENVRLGEVECRPQSIADKREQSFVADVGEEGVLGKNPLVNLKVDRHFQPWRQTINEVVEACHRRFIIEAEALLDLCIQLTAQIVLDRQLVQKY